MKKVWSLILVFAMLFCLAGCGGTSTEEGVSPDVPAGQTEPSAGDVANDPDEDAAPQATDAAKCISCNQYADPNSPYCNYCGCWEMDCPMPHKDGSNYCVSHACLLCGNPKHSSAYCDQHECDACDNVVVEGSQYCVAHKCLLCNNKVFGTSSYCPQHG